MGQVILSKKIIEQSVSKSCDKAKPEWTLTGIYSSEDPEECACGHYPIIELCEITNTKSGNAMTVGSECVKKFLGITSEKLFAALNRVKKNVEHSVNPAVIATIEGLGTRQDMQ